MPPQRRTLHFGSAIGASVRQAFDAMKAAAGVETLRVLSGVHQGRMGYAEATTDVEVERWEGALWLRLRVTHGTKYGGTRSKAVTWRYSERSPGDLAAALAATRRVQEASLLPGPPPGADPRGWLSRLLDRLTGARYRGLVDMTICPAPEGKWRYSAEVFAGDPAYLYFTQERVKGRRVASRGSVTLSVEALWAAVRAADNAGLDKQGACAGESTSGHIAGTADA